jgi:hypothetical protein
LLCASFLQFYVFLTLSTSLRQMAATQWPGFTDQGFWLIQDLTQTAVVLGEKSWYLMHAPYSFAGFLLPFALLWMYRETTQKSPVGRWEIAAVGKAACSAAAHAFSPFADLAGL